MRVRPSKTDPVKNIKPEDTEGEAGVRSGEQRARPEKTEMEGGGERGGREGERGGGGNRRLLLFQGEGSNSCRLTSKKVNTGIHM